MALELRIHKNSITTTGLLIIKDVTGDYDSSANPGGYGTPNPDRDDIALLLRSFNNRYNGGTYVTSVPVVATPDDSDPLESTTWEVAIDKQGWYKIVLYGCRILDEAVLLNINEVVWNELTVQFELITERSGSGPYTYTTIEATAEHFDSDNYIKYYSDLLDTYADDQLCLCYNKAVRKYFQTKEDLDKERYRKIQAYLTVMTNNFLTGSPAKGQEVAEQVETICNCFTIDCNC